MEELRTIISEELGISEDVVRISKEIYDKILEELKVYDQKEKTNTMVISRLSFNYLINDVRINCSIVYRNFLSTEIADSMEMKYITDGASEKITNNLYFCFINIFAVCGTIAKEKAMETIQHEVEHIYQQIRMGKSFGGESLYLKAMSDMESTDQSRHDIGKMFYCLLKSEQEAFANELYAYLMDLNEPYTEERLKESETWENYIFVKETLNKLQNDFSLKEIFNEYYEQFGIIAKNLKSELSNFLRRIGRVVVKVKKDKLRQGWRK